MQILGLLGVYFHVVVVEVEKYLLFLNLAMTILWIDVRTLFFFEGASLLLISNLLYCSVLEDKVQIVGL